MKLSDSKKLYYTSIACAVMAFASFGLLTSPLLAGALGISTTAANQVVNLISAYSTVTTVISIVGAITGVGSIGSGVAAAVLYILKKKGKAAAALY
nr:uberolysin/carnocyclin family circular bacteriocin [Streptococcus orisasini]